MVKSNDIVHRKSGNVGLNPVFVTLLNYLSIKPICITVKKPQDDTLVNWMHQVIYNMLVTNINMKLFNFKGP